MSEGSSIRKMHTLKNRPEASIEAVYEAEKKLVDEALADFVQLPTKKKYAGLWQKKIKPEILANMTPKEIKRQEAIHEIIESESFYLRDLAMTYRLFAIPLQNNKILSYNEYKEIFCNFGEIISFHAEVGKAMRQLRTASGEVYSIGKTMLDTMADLELCYASYCSGRSKARDFLNQKRKDSVKLNKFVKQVELDPECRKLELDTFLSQPWQRLMHYPLLFQNILKSTPEGNPDQQDLAEVIRRLNAVIAGVNIYTESIEFKRTLEDLNTWVNAVSKAKAAEIDCLSPERKVLMVADLRSKWGRKLHGYLLDNSLIIVLPTEKPSLYCEPFLIQYLEIQTFSDQVSITTNSKGEKAAAKVQRNHFLLINKQNGTKLTVHTESAGEKRKWIDAIQAELLKVSNVSWRDAYDQDYQLHEPTDPGKHETKSLTEAKTLTLPRKGDDTVRRASGDTVQVNSLEVVRQLVSDPFGLLSYAKTMATCTAAMVEQLNAKALLTDDYDQRDHLWSIAKTIADATINLVQRAKLLAQKLSDQERNVAVSNFFDAFQALHAALSLNVDDLEDVVATDNKIEVPREDENTALPGTDAAVEIIKISKMNKNDKCAECFQDDPIFVSLDWGIFVCPNCVEAHKQVFRSINNIDPSFKELGKDVFTVAEVDSLYQLGNENADRVFAANVPESVTRLSPQSTLEERTNWVKRKYFDKEFITTPGTMQRERETDFKIKIEVQAS